MPSCPWAIPGTTPRLLLELVSGEAPSCPSPVDPGEEAPTPLHPVLGGTQKLIYGSDFRATRAPPASLGKTALLDYAASLGIAGFPARW